MVRLDKEEYGLPRWCSGKESTYQWRRHRTSGSQVQSTRFDLWVEKIPWRKERQPTAVFFPRESRGQRSLVGYSPWGCKESDMRGSEKLDYLQGCTATACQAWPHLQSRSHHAFHPHAVPSFQCCYDNSFHPKPRGLL